MIEPTKLTDLLRKLAASISIGKIDESAVDELERNREALIESINQLDDASKLRFAALSTLLENAANRIDELEASGIQPAKTWGRQDISIPAETDAVLSKTWGRQGVDLSAGKEQEK